MPKSYNKVISIHRILTIKHYLFFISLFSIAINCNADNFNPLSSTRQLVNYNANNFTTYHSMVYVLSEDGDIVEYKRSTNNKLSIIGRIKAGINPQAFTFSKNHEFMLVTNYGGIQQPGSISLFKVNSDGILVPNTPAEEIIPGMKNPTSIIASNTYLSKNSIYIAGKAESDNSLIVKMLLDDNGKLSQIESSIIIPDFSVNRIKLDGNQLAALDSIGNTVYILQQSSLALIKIIDRSNSLIEPTDLLFFSDDKSDEELITNFGDNMIVNFGNLTGEFDYKSSGIGPLRIIKNLSWLNGSMAYVLNTDNITIFKIKPYTHNLDFFKSVAPTSQNNIYSDMIIFNSQLYITEYIYNTISTYNILSDGDITFNQSMTTYPKPIAVLAD